MDVRVHALRVNLTVVSRETNTNRVRLVRGEIGARSARVIIYSRPRGLQYEKSVRYEYFRRNVIVRDTRESARSIIIRRKQTSVRIV